MGAYVARRLIAAVLMTAAIATAVFLLLRAVPGDVVVVMLGENSASPDKIAAMRHVLGLDRPLLDQYLTWLGRLARGDFGTSILSGRPIGADLAVRLPRSLELGAVALAAAVVLGIPLGTVAARRAGRALDFAITGVSVLGLTFPSFVVGTVFVLVFGLVFHWFPATGYVPFSDDPIGHLRHLVLPAATLALTFAPVVLRMTRAGMLETLSQDFVRTARAKGLAEPAVVVRHVLRNSLIPVVTVLGLQAGELIGRIVLIEYIFNWPGVSSLLLSGAFQRDYPLVQAVVIVVAGAFVLINLAVDLTYMLIDPRIRLT
ncbi:MAG TPA: ABC transporter permease [bacterium]|nr:ABC transporter permease [bacterium]